VAKRKFRILRRYFDSLKKYKPTSAKDSPKNAQKFVDEANKTLESIQAYPETFPPEYHLNGKRQLYRFAIHAKNYKIVFKVLKPMVIVLDIVDTRRYPREIKTLKTTNYED